MKWFYDLTTRTKLFLGFGLIVLLMMTVILVAYNGSITYQKSQNQLYQEDFLSSVKLLEFRSSQNRIRANVFEMAIEKDRSRQQALEKDIDERSQQQDAGLKIVAESFKGRPEELRKLEELVAALDDYRKTRAEQVSLIYADRTDEAQQLAVTDQQDRHLRVRNLADELGESALAGAQSKIAETKTQTILLSRIFVTIGLFALVLGVATVLLLSRVIANPLKEITTAAARIAAGDLGVVIDSGKREDEVGHLTRAFGVMVEYLQNMAATSRQMAGGDLAVTVRPLSDQDSLGNAFLAMTGYLREMAEVSRQVAGGDLTVTVTPVTDRDILGNAYANMLANLRKINQEVRDVVSVLAASVSEILASTTQVATGIAETASSVSETTATVEEVKQTAQLSTEKSRIVSKSAQDAAMVAEQGNVSVTETIEGINHIKELMGTVAESVVMLSEQTQSIGEIITVVNDLAQQSNLLAVNAAIEASKAGEMGKGFVVVAQEIKSLADQSKQATEQVRVILGDIQKATGKSVLAAEQATKAVDGGVKQAAESGEAIRKLADAIRDSAQAAAQIAASSQQQLAGMEQVAMAMESIKQAAQQNASGTKQAEQAAHTLNELGQKLKNMVAQFKV